MENADRIAKLNDAFRRERKFVFTRGIAALEDINALCDAVRDFDAFTEDNDPHGEHDFGSMVWEDQKIFWKIDYYDQDLRHWCDPLSASCRRVITIMLASEY